MLDFKRRETKLIRLISIYSTKLTNTTNKHPIFEKIQRKFDKYFLVEPWPRPTTPLEWLNVLLRRNEKNTFLINKLESLLRRMLFVCVEAKKMH